MLDLLFNLFAVFTVACALGVVFNKNAIASALCLLLCLVGVAGLFALLDAMLLAFVLVFVYAGAVVALFLFIIMLLDAQGGTRRAFGRLAVAAGMLATGLLTTGVILLASSLDKSGNMPLPPADPTLTSLTGAAEILFTQYLLPVQVVGFLLLIAMLGVIVLSKRFAGLEDIK
ncbi:MAG: NADH-quinone oxidoreductase subunit J [Verrucomicrobiota bacterium]